MAAEATASEPQPEPVSSGEPAQGPGPSLP